MFTARLCVMFGLTLLMTFVLYYLRDVVGMTQPERGTAGVAAMALLGAAVSTFYAGRLSDDADRSAVVFLAGVPMAAAALGFAYLPSLSDILLFGVLYGLGYGAFLSVDWALALDTLPRSGRAGRDLGIWGMASNLPAVFAPVAGAWLIARYPSPAQGYHALFILSGLSFLAGSVVVLRAGRARPLRAAGHLSLRLGVAAGLLAYARLRYRVRVEGSLGRRRLGLLVVANHLHDLDGMVLPPLLYLGGDLRQAPVSAGSRRMFEPGFLADRLGRGLDLPLRRLSLGGVLGILGVVPIENLPRRRPLASLVDASGLDRRLPLATLCDDVALEALRRRFGPAVGGLPLAAPLYGRRRDLGQAEVSVAHVREPARSRILARMRSDLRVDLARLDRLMARGRTVYLTPEGEISRDGSLGRFRLALDGLRQRARTVAIASLAYDSLRPGRLTVHIRLVPLEPGRDLRTAILAERVVTASQVVARVLLARRTGATLGEMERAAEAAVRALPPGARLESGLARSPAHAARIVLRAMRRRGQLAPAPEGAPMPAVPVRDARFPLVAEMLAYQARLLAETEEALLREAGASAPALPAGGA